MKDNDNLTIERPNFVTHLECAMEGDHYPADQIHNLSKAGKPLLVRVLFTNSGKSVANETRALVTLTTVMEPLKDIDKFATERVPTDQHPTSVFPGQEIAANVFTDYLITQGDLDRLATGTVYMYVLGHVDYRDIFDIPHRTEFCAMAKSREPSFSVCPQHNHAT